MNGSTYINVSCVLLISVIISALLLLLIKRWYPQIEVPFSSVF